MSTSTTTETERFQFGENWAKFSSHLDDERIGEAERSLREMLGTSDLTDSSFVDIGCGSGLFSLAAVRLGARRVQSFDYDPASVSTSVALRERHRVSESTWAIEQGSALDCSYLESLGTFDIVYSWGVLHHTGDMWSALENVVSMVKPGGRLFISIYNDQGRPSRRWRAIKRLYNRLPAGMVRNAYVVLIMGPLEFRAAVASLVRLRPQRYVRAWTEYKRSRGMSRWHDLVDWVGGYPFEVATPEAIFDFYRERGFLLQRLETCGGGWGCNQFVFERMPEV